MRKGVEVEKEMELESLQVARLWRLSEQWEGLQIVQILPNFRYLKGLTRLHRAATEGLYFKVKAMVQQEKEGAGKP